MWFIGLLQSGLHFKASVPYLVTLNESEVTPINGLFLCHIVPDSFFEMMSSLMLWDFMQCMEWFRVLFIPGTWFFLYILASGRVTLFCLNGTARVMYGSQEVRLFQPIFPTVPTFWYVSYLSSFGAVFPNPGWCLSGFHDRWVPRSSHLSTYDAGTSVAIPLDLLLQVLPSVSFVVLPC